MKKNIFIIGSGNIGSKHVQSLTKLKKKVNIYVVDPNNKNLNRTKNIYYKNSSNKNISNIFFYSHLVKINKKIDIAIVATNSNMRKQVIENLLSINSVKYLIIEKVAFQNINDFKHIINLLNKKKIKCYVNFPRRLFDSYQKLKKKIAKEKQIHLSCVGINWGMACNSLHMLDLFKYLTNAKKILVDEISLKNKVYKSERKGFIELKGTLKFKTPNGDTLHLYDQTGDKNKITFGGIKIENKNFLYSIQENFHKIVCINNKPRLKVYVRPFKFIHQSNLTNIFVNDLLNNKEIQLTKIKEAYDLHKIILEIFTKHIQKYGKNIKGCPIT